MADQSIPLLTLGGAYTGAVVIGAPLPVALMAALGTLVALSNSERVTFSLREVGAVLVSLCMAWSLGLFVGYLLAWAVLQKYPGAPAVVLHAVFALILSAYGQSKLLPPLLARFTRFVEGGQ